MSFKGHCQKTLQKTDGVTVRMFSPLPSCFSLPYFPTASIAHIVPILLPVMLPNEAWRSILSRLRDQSFLTSLLPCSLCPSTLHLNTDGERVTFQHSSSTSNCTMFRATLSSPHKAFTHQEAQLSCFQISLEKFEMLKWQTNVQRKDPKGRYYVLGGRLHISLPALASVEVLQ